MNTFRSIILLGVIVSCLVLHIAANPSFLANVRYGELYRPGYHFSPPQDWMNDPNGLLYFAGEYHLFYQRTPGSTQSGIKVWGHAVSTDLVHWQNLEDAINPYSDVSIWSGSAVADKKNVSGLCTNEEGCIIAFYTAQSPGKQAQALAFSNDRGRTFTEYPGNPIIDENTDSFRDPKVFWDKFNQRWVMVTVLANQHKSRFYNSSDLIHWTTLSDFGPQGDVSGDWECPDLFLLSLDDGSGEKWVYGHSLSSTVQYFVGDFDGQNFTNANPSDQILKVNFGRDYYAANTWNDQPKNRRLIIGWATNPGYSGATPTSVWKCSMSLIHELTLHQYPEGIRIKQKPIVELEQLRSSPVHYDNLVVASNTTTLSLQGPQLELIVVFELPTDATTEFGVKVFVGDGQETIVGYDVKSQSLFVDRTNSGDVSFASDFPGRVTQVMPTDNGLIEIRVFVDQSFVDVFGNDGRVVMTEMVFPDPTKGAVEIYSIGGNVTARSVDGWVMNGIWTSEFDKISV